MVRRGFLALTLTSAVLVACNILTGAASLAVDDQAKDAATPTSDATPAPTSTAVETVAPPAPDASTHDAAIDSGPPLGIGTFNGHRYEVVVVTDPITWDSAKAAAQSKGGHLATITSRPENTFVAKLGAEVGAWTDDGAGPWLGGVLVVDGGSSVDGGVAGAWTWITGEAFNFTNWQSGQPDNDDGTETVLGYLGNSTSAEWNDWRVSGDDDVLSYVIEYETP